MFIAIIFISLGLITIGAFRDWLSTFYLCPKAVQKRLHKISELIFDKKWELAKKSLLPILTKKSGGKQAQLCYIQILRGTEEWEKALKVTQKAARKFPEELIFRLEEGKILLAQGEAKQALAAFRVASPILNNEADIFLFAKAHFLLKEYDKSLRLMDPWLSQSQNGELLLLAGNCFYEQKQYLQAACAYKRALDLVGNSHQIMTQLGHSLRRLGNLAEAEAVFLSILEKDSHDLAAILGYGACLVERGQYQKALLFYQASNCWTLYDPRILTPSATCALKLKRYQEAAHYLEICIKNGDSSLQTLAYYGYSLECQQQWQGAEQVYRRIILEYPSQPHGYRGLAWMFGVGVTTTLSSEEGLSLAHIALKLVNDTPGWEILSACEARAGNFERAYAIRAQLAQQDPETTARSRHQRAMRALRKNLPLNDALVNHSLVAVA